MMMIIIMIIIIIIISFSLLDTAHVLRKVLLPSKKTTPPRGLNLFIYLLIFCFCREPSVFREIKEVKEKLD